MEDKKCKVEGCGNQGKLHSKGHRYFPRGFCNPHYKKWARHNKDIIQETKENRSKSCSVENCNNLAPYKKGMCTKHYYRFMKHGDENFVEKRVEGQTKHPLYNTYQGMKSRCLNKNDKDYVRYGGRGVKIDESWLGVNGFFNFVNDMGERPEGCSIDRIDSNGGYSIDNCRWSDANTQNLNKNNIKNRGVSYYQDLNKYRVRISVNGINHNIGWFNDRKEAIQARKEAELRLIGYIIEVDEEV